MKKNSEKDLYENLFDKETALKVIYTIFDDKTSKELSDRIKKIDTDNEKELLKKNTEKDFLFNLNKSIEQKNDKIKENNNNNNVYNYGGGDDEELEILTMFDDENSLKLKLVDIIDKNKDKETKMAEMENMQTIKIPDIYVQQTIQKFKHKKYNNSITCLRLLNIRKTNYNYGEKYILQEFFWDEKNMNIYTISVDNKIKFIIPETFS